MEWLLAVLVLGMGAVGVRRLVQRRRAATADAEELDGVRAMADEDTTMLGEQLRALGVDSAGTNLDEATRADYQAALDAYESAKWAVPRLHAVEEISAVIDTLSTGRYALACVRARLEGRPLPELRVPCFFNPQHGPSVRDVRWTKPGGHGTRTVPACGQDAARVEAGENSKVREIKIGKLTGSYWDTGAAYLPYGEHYFQSGVLETYNRRLDQGPLGG